MDFFILASIAAIGLYILKSSDERKRISLLGAHLGKYQIEKLMETLTHGYMRALGENSAERRDPIWRQMESSEQKLCEQFSRFAADFARAGEADARVSKLQLAFPYARKILPAMTFDARKVLAIHARGLALAVENEAQLAPKDKAFLISAELFLMQHSCHWFCKSKNIASARMMVRHKTSYEQLLASVSAETREAYRKAVIG
jgi:hypothetical protein